MYRRAVEHLLALRPEFAPPFAQEVLLQFDRFRPEDVPLLQSNASQWLPDIGLGFWSHREAPTLWTRDEFINSTQDELRPLMHRIFRIQQEKKAVQSAWEALLGSGVLLRMAAPDAAAFYDAALKYYQPQITEVSFRSFPFYVPLLEGEALRQASGSDLQQWLCGAAGYVRESSEDGGLLLMVSAENHEWLEGLADEDDASEIMWQIEVSRE